MAFLAYLNNMYVSVLSRPVCNATHLLSERRGNIRVGYSEPGQKVLNITGGRRWLQMSTNIAVNPPPTAENEFLDKKPLGYDCTKLRVLILFLLFFGFKG